MNPKLWVVALGVVCIAWILLAAWRVDRAPKCLDCGWREGHRPDCSVLARLVDEEMRDDPLDRLVAQYRAGEITKDEAMAALDQIRRRQ